MISREDFKRYMEFMKKQSDYYDYMQSLFDDNRDIVGDAMAPIPGSNVIILELLEKHFNLKEDDSGYTDLSWWIYETNFGRDFKIGDIENQNFAEGSQYRVPDLSTLDKLYDYLVWLSELERICAQ